MREAIDAGALGFSMSRTIAHVAIDGEPVPGTFAAEEEVFGIGRALGELGKGVFELAPMGAAGEDITNPAKEVDWMRRLSAEIGRPVTFALHPGRRRPGPLARADGRRRATRREEGAELWPQVAGRATGLLSGFFTTYCLFDVVPAFAAFKAPRSLAAEQMLAKVSDPEFRAEILGWEPDEETAKRLNDAYAKTFLLGDPPDYEPSYDRSLAGIADATGKHPIEVAYDAMMVGDGEGAALRPDPQLQLRQPRPGPRDAAAPAVGSRARRRRRALRRHLRRVDADLHAHALDARPLPRRDAAARAGREEADPRHRPALRPDRPRHPRARHGRRRQLLIDYERLQLLPPEVAADLPAGGRAAAAEGRRLRRDHQAAAW